MEKLIRCSVSGLVGLLLLATGMRAQALQDPLLEQLTGKWVLTGTIAGKSTTHDVTAEWVLGHQYIQMHEVSRERDAQGRPQYEAIILIGNDSASKGYACLWLDSTGNGGLNGQTLGHAAADTGKIAFLFEIGKSRFHTTFLYDSRAGTWEWRMDGEEGGKLEPFARLKMVRR